MTRFPTAILVILGLASMPAAWADTRTELQQLFADERAFTWRADPLAATCGRRP